MVEFIKYLKEILDKDKDKKWKLIALILLVSIFISSNIIEFYEHLSSIPILEYVLHSEVIKYLSAIVFLLWIYYLGRILESIKTLYRANKLKLDKTNFKKAIGKHNSVKENLIDILANSFLLSLLGIVLFLIIQNNSRGHLFLDLSLIPLWAFMVYFIYPVLTFVYFNAKLIDKFLSFDVKIRFSPFNILFMIFPRCWY